MLKDTQEIPADIDSFRSGTERICELVCYRKRFQLIGRKFHFKESAVSGNFQFTTERGKRDNRFLWDIFFKEDISAGERSMSAQINLSARGKPAQMIAVPLRHSECCFRKIIFSCDIHH